VGWGLVVVGVGFGGFGVVLLVLVVLVGLLVGLVCCLFGGFIFFR